MSSRELLLACFALIIFSVLITPCAACIGIPSIEANMASEAALCGGIVLAFLTVSSEAKLESSPKEK
jgi:hypothetical protein